LDFVGSKFGAGAFPGTRSDSSRKLRPLSGSTSMSAAGMTVSTTDPLVSTAATPMPPATSTFTRTFASASSTTTDAVCPTSSRNPSRFSERNPVADTDRSTVPGGRFGATNVPSASVTTCRAWPVPGAEMETAAAATAAPCAS
jgi:hypothetical protein